MRTYLFWLGAALVALAFPVDAGEVMTLAVTPRHSFSPTNLTVRVHVAPDRDNRVLEIVADSGGFYRSSEVRLEGAAAPRTVVVEYRAVPSGEYEVYGVLRNGAGQTRATARQQALVIASAGER